MKMARPFLRKPDLKLVRCVHCSMIYVNPVPVEMATGNFYDPAGSEYVNYFTGQTMKTFTDFNFKTASQTNNLV